MSNKKDRKPKLPFRDTEEIIKSKKKNLII